MIKTLSVKRWQKVNNSKADFTGKRVTVVGMARSGIAAARALYALGAIVTVTDKKPPDQLGAQVKALGSGRIAVAAGGHPDRIFIETDLVVLSPGVPKIPQILQAQRHGVKVISELELAWLLSSSPYIGITGTNGKSTVTTLVGLMLEQSRKKVLVAGNIGNALTEDPRLLAGQDWIVAELSSFQLEDIETFKPQVAAVLNLTQDHLDRYHDIAEYGEAKARIFMNQQRDDFLVLNFDDPLVKSFSRRASATVIPFSRLQRFNPGACVLDGHLVFNGRRVCRVDEIKIKGVHNLENALAAAAVSLCAGADSGTVADVLRKFPGLEHRLEFVRQKDGVTYINDSKGTNVGAVLKSVEGFTQPVILIAGGLDKGSDFSPLNDLFKKKVKLLILIGKAADKMAEVLGTANETLFAKTLQDAVTLASHRAQAGDVVLLSPACASFDMFRDFEDRGKQFKEAVKAL
ncbi:MAG TPA: UDP-N-acetylmuramoyl-L-alanine--D-glutamate ligase [Nitrospirota bacterium]|nr:UDP-N-acetylmuramoyl-L-alanine--D-glutamate ligase [Nitrospirota bacterium]